MTNYSYIRQSSQELLMQVMDLDAALIQELVYGLSKLALKTCSSTSLEIQCACSCREWLDWKM